MSCDLKGTLAELPGTDIRRTGNCAGNDDRRLICGAHDAACGDANVPAYSRTKRGYYRLHPQFTLAHLITADNLR